MEFNYKPGDLFYLKSAITGCEYISIYKNIDAFSINTFITFDLHDNKLFVDCSLIPIHKEFDIRLANNQEKELLIQKMIKNNFFFDKEELKLVNVDEL